MTFPVEDMARRMPDAVRVLGESLKACFLNSEFKVFTKE
jgi:hypothetical protein